MVIETPPSECAYDLIFGCFSNILSNSYAFNFWKKKCLGKEVGMKNISPIWELQLTERNCLVFIYIYKHTEWWWSTLESWGVFPSAMKKAAPINLQYGSSHTDWCYSPMEEKQWGLYAFSSLQTSHAKNPVVLAQWGAPQPLHPDLVITLMKNIWITQLNGRIASI